MLWWMLLACGSGEDTSSGTLAVETNAGLYQINIAYAPDPPVVGETTWTMELSTDAGGVAGAIWTITPWMPAHEHGVSEAPEVVDQNAGSYTATWSYPMAGSWEITLEIEANDGTDSVVVDQEVQ